MALTLQQIMDEADILVPNAAVLADKIIWLNAINQEFFDIVKIPNVTSMTSIALTPTYTLITNIRDRNIYNVKVGNSSYSSLLYEDSSLKQNYYTYNESTNVITLTPAPSQTGVAGTVKYYSIGTTTFITSTLGISPDAPSEYHWIYILGLSEKIAKSMNDIGLANNYGNDYKNALTVAAQNYQLKGATNG